MVLWQYSRWNFAQVQAFDRDITHSMPVSPIFASEFWLIQKARLSFPSSSYTSDISKWFGLSQI